MIVNEKIFVSVGTANVEFYKNKGYEILYGKDKKGRRRVMKEIPLQISVYDLPLKSNVKILVMCEDCGSERYITAHTVLIKDMENIKIHTENIRIWKKREK